MDVIRAIISGGQSGADLGALEFAKKYGIQTGGFAPKGYRTEDGTNIDLKMVYRLKEHVSPKYTPRTEVNVKNSHLTIVFMPTRSKGSALTIKLARKYRKERIIIYNIQPSNPWYISENAKFIIKLKNELRKPLIINVAGNRESVSPGIRVAVKRYLKSLIAEIERRANGN